MKYLDRLKKEKELNSGSAETTRQNPRVKFGAESKKRPVILDIRPPQKKDKIPAPSTPAEEIIEPTLQPPAPIKHEPQRPSEPEHDIAVRTWEPKTIRRRRRVRKIMLAAMGLAAAAVFLLPTILFPRFSIIIYPKIFSTTVPNIELLADTSSTAPDASLKKIPALRIEVEKGLSREYDASGVKFFRDRAKGRVLIFNAFSSSPQTLVASTRLQDPSGKVFRLVKSVTVPGAKVSEGKIIPTSIAAEVLADAPGEDYNIDPTEFRIPGFRGTARYQGFYARSEEKFSGGFEGEAKIVLSDDLKKASEDVTKALVEELRSELDQRVPSDPDFLAPAGGRQISILNIEQPKPGERHDRLTVTASGRGRLIVVRRSHAAETLGAIMLAPAQEFAVNVSKTQDKLSFSDGRAGSSPKEFVFTVSGELDYWREINTGDLAGVLRTSTPKKAEAYLRGREEIGSFRIKRFPLWLWFIPGHEGGLKINVEPPA